MIFLPLLHARVLVDEWMDEGMDDGWILALSLHEIYLFSDPKL